MMVDLRNRGYWQDLNYILLIRALICNSRFGGQGSMCYARKLVV